MLKKHHDSLQGSVGHGFAEDHVEHVGDFGGVISEKALDGLVDGLRVGRAEIGWKEDVPMGLHHIVCNMEYVLDPIRGHIVAHGP